MLQQAFRRFLGFFVVITAMGALDCAAAQMASLSWSSEDGVIELECGALQLKARDLPSIAKLAAKHGLLKESSNHYDSVGALKRAFEKSGWSVTIAARSQYLGRGGYLMRRVRAPQTPTVLPSRVLPDDTPDRARAAGR